MLHHSASAHVWLMSKFEVDTLPFLNLSINLVTPNDVNECLKFSFESSRLQKKKKTKSQKSQIGMVNTLASTTLVTHYYVL
jgi:hypothetical protein